MMKVVQLLMLLGISFSLIGCEDDEPQVIFCAVTSLTECTCYPLGNEIIKPIKECLGYIMLSPDDFGKSAVHHKELHDDLIWCE